MKLVRYTPSQLVSEHNVARSEMPPLEFFGPKQQKARERYCAALFSSAYEQAKSPCAVALEKPDPQNDVDFYLECHSVLHEFQITEIQEPGRRRGDEYKTLESGAARLEDWTNALEEGPEWIRSAIAKKLKAYAHRVQRMNLLVYVNFPAYDITYEDVRIASAEVAEPFSSVWLMTGNAIACIKTNPQLGELSGWYLSLVATGEA